MGRHRYSFAQQTCIKKSGLALQKAAPLSPGCRIGVAVSGGMDSLTLLKILQIRRAIVPFSFEIMALHCNPGFDSWDHLPLAAWLASEGIAAHLEVCDFGPLAHSDLNRKKSPCFLCAWSRRKRLFDLCAQYGLTHLALGHVAEDLVSTFMLNLLRNGQVAALPICENFFNGRLKLIRPLLLTEKKFIRQASRQWKLPVFKNSCPSAGKTARTGMENLLADLDQKLPGCRSSVLNGLCRWQLSKESGQPESR